jgi:hypothetical protein
LAYQIGLPIDDKEKLVELSQGFYDHSGGIFDGCLVAIDGLAVITRQPFNHEVKYKKDYHYHKGGFAIVVIAGCDSNCCFVVASCKHSGSTNDTIAWQQMELYKAIEIDKRLPLKYFLLGMKHLPILNTSLVSGLVSAPTACLTSYLFSSSLSISPFPFHICCLGLGLDRYKDSFNYWLSHSRQTIEQSFGILMQPWGIFW